MTANNRKLLTVITVTLLICVAVIFGLILNKNSGETSSSDVESTYSSDASVYDDSKTESTESDDAEVSSCESSDDVSEVSADVSAEASVDVSESESFDFLAEYADSNVKSSYLAVYDVENGRIVYGRGADKLCYPASITKLLTAITAVDYFKADEIITVGKEIQLIGEGSSRAWIGVGFKMTFAQLLDAMLIPSGNDAAYSIAVACGRKILGKENVVITVALDAFIDRMNEKAKEIGMTDTHFANPDGYHHPEHYTTPKDIAVLCEKVLENNLILASCQKTYVECKVMNGPVLKLSNSNKLLSSYKYTTGLKTGTTSQAGYCLAASAEKDGRSFIIVILGAETTNSRFTDSKKLFELIYNNIQ